MNITQSKQRMTAIASNVRQAFDELVTLFVLLPASIIFALLMVAGHFSFTGMARQIYEFSNVEFVVSQNPTTFRMPVCTDLQVANGGLVKDVPKPCEKFKDEDISIEQLAKQTGLELMLLYGFAFMGSFLVMAAFGRFTKRTKESPAAVVKSGIRMSPDRVLVAELDTGKPFDVDAIKQRDQDALLFASEILIEIRNLASNSPTPEQVKTIARLADSMHNIPRLIASGESDAMAFLIDGGVSEGLQVWRDAIPSRSPTSVS